MRKWLGIALAGLAALAWTGTARATNYALCTGLNKYKTSYVDSSSFLNGCVPDAKNVYTNITLRGEWQSANATLFTNDQGTFAAVSNKLMSLASTAVSGDVVLYYHSSHGYQDSGKNTGICMYDKDMPDSSFAKILANFKSGVKVVVVLDTCHSGGMFKSIRRDGTTRALDTASPFSFAQRVNEELAAIRADEAARGIRTAAKLAVLDCAWITAADYNQYSWDGDVGGAFTDCFIGSVKSGDCDKSPYGNGDSYATFMEMFDYAVAQDETHGDGNPGSEDYTMPQCTNTPILKAVTFGWVGKEEPSGIRFAPIPEQTATVGAPISCTLVASNVDGSTGAITFSVASSTAPAGSYSLSGADFTFTAPADGSYSFDFLATNKTAKTFGKASMNVSATLAAPAGLANSGITDSSFTASWDATPGAVSYYLEVFAADEASASAKAADGSFALVTAEDGLTEGEYVIVAENADVAMNNTCSGASSGYLACTDVAVDGSSISTDDASVIWTLAGDASSCTLFNAAAGMYVNPATSKSIGWAAEASGAWTLSLADGIVTAANAKDTSWVLQYNSSSPRFMCYSSSQKKLRFFRRDGASGALFSGDVGSATSYTVEGLIPGDYTWRVRAIGNAKGPWSETQEVTLFADPSSPPSIRAIADIEIDVGETATATVAVSTPEQAPVTSLSITAGDAAATLEEGVFSFAPAAPGTYDFTITAVNANGPAEISFAVVATLAEPETPEQPAVVASDGFTAEWEAVPGAASYELVVIEGQGGSSGGGGSGGGSGETLTETFAGATFSPGGTSYTSQTIAGDLGTWTSSECQKNDAGPIVRATGTLTSPSIESGVAGVELDYIWPYSDSSTFAIDLYVNGTKKGSASVTGGTPGTAQYSFDAVSGAATVEFKNTSTTSKKDRLIFDTIRITTAAKSIARAAGDVVFSNNVGNVTSYDVTGLQSSTEYTFAFRAVAENGETTDWSAPVTVKTDDGPSAPAWSAIPAQHAYVGATFQLDLSGYLSGSPTPAVTADTGTVSGLHFVYEPDATGPVTVTLTAVNGSGTDTVSFSLAVDEPPVGGTHYAVIVGCNKYDTEYIDSGSWLNGCVPDANHVQALVTSRGQWDAANVAKLTDSSAKHSAVLSAIASAASKAVPGDTFLYFHSSHGGNYTYSFVTNTALYTDWPIMVYSVDPEGVDNCVCTYDADFTAAELASALADFDPAVNIVVMIDACHSAGMFLYDDGTPVSQRVVRRNAAGKAMRSADPGLFAESVGAQIGAIRRARGIRAAANVAFVTAANFDEYSFDSQSGDGGEFTTAFIEGVTNGLCDGADDGDQDGWATFYEGWNYAKDIATGIPEGTEVDYDGHAVDANGYALYDNSDYAQEYDEPEYYYDYYFTHPQIDNESLLRVVRVGYAGTPTLDAPVAAEAADVTASSFTASWSAVADATGYRVQVATDPSFSTGASADTIVADDLAATSTSYTEFSDVAKDSGAVYAGKSAKNSEGAIQLNNKTETGAGIWTTASGGNASRVAVEWNSATAAKRSLQIYGSDTALSSYSAVKAATLLGTIDYGSASDLAIDGTYAYVGILANGGAVYLDSVTVEWGTAGSGSSIVLDDNVGNVTTCDVSNLEPETAYWYRVQALGDPVDSDFSNVIGLTTDASAPYAPVWGEIPPQTASAGAALVVDLKPYVTGSPKPAITADAGTVENGVLTVSFAAAGDYTVTVTAANSEGSANATLVVTVTDAPVTVPVLTLSNATDSTFDADWTACTGASEYQFQVATDDQFTPGGGGEGGGAFKLVTSAEGLIAGEYVILAETADTAMNNTCSGASAGYLACTDVTVEDSTVTTDDASIIWTLAGDASSCTLHNGAAGKYANPAASKSVGWSETASGSWTLTVSDGIVTAANAADTTWMLQYNSNSPRFMCYSSNQKKLRFFRRDASRSPAKDGGSLLLDTTTNGLSLTVTGLEPETTYYARVRMAGGEWSAVGSIATTGEGPVGPAKYALCVGVNEYDFKAYEAMGYELTPLRGTVNDATTMRDNLVARGGWTEANATLLTDEAATEAAVRSAMAGFAARAKAGDTFVYQHSSHGLGPESEDDTDADIALGLYDNLYSAEDFAEDLAAFPAGAKVVVLIDACHSAGMFKHGSRTATRSAAFDIAARVSAIMDARRAARRARGEDVSRSLSSEEIGWVTAADIYESSRDGGFYDTEEWMEDDDAEGEVTGGYFLASFTWGWWTGKADVSGTGDGDGWFDAYEGWSYSLPVCEEGGHHPQFLHEDVLRSVELGWIGDAAPSAAIVFDPVPGATVGIGEEALLEGIAARNADGTSDGIVLSVVAAPEGAEYTFENGTLAFTPDEDGLFLFTIQAANADAGTSATKLLGVTAVLPAPVALDATDVADNSFTANWQAVDAPLFAYQLQVSTDPAFPAPEPEMVLDEGFDGVTNKASLEDKAWTFTGTFGTYTSSAYCGEDAPSIKFSSGTSVLTSPNFRLSGEAAIRFWTRGNGSNVTSTLKVELLVDGEWTGLDTFVPSPDGEQKEYDAIDVAAKQLRFTCTKNVGNVALDDVQLLCLPADAAMALDTDEIDPAATSYPVEDLVPGTTYYYRLRAIANTRSEWSETIEVTTTGEAPLPVPEVGLYAPLTDADTSIGAIMLGADGLQVRVQVATDETFADPVHDETTTASFLLVTGLAPETTYYVRACVIDGDRAGDWSDIQTITTAAAEPGPQPSAAAITDMTIAGGQMTITFEGDGAQVLFSTDLVDWTPVEGATSPYTFDMGDGPGYIGVR